MTLEEAEQRPRENVRDEMDEPADEPKVIFTMPLICSPDCGDDMASSILPEHPPVHMPEWSPRAP